MAQEGKPNNPAEDVLELGKSAAEVGVEAVGEVAAIAEDIKETPPVREVRKFWHKLGPGLVTGAADDDASGVVMYSQTGAAHGPKLLWLAPLTFPMMAVIQEMCARIGLVTGRGLAANIKKHFPRPILYIAAFFLFDMRNSRLLKLRQKSSVRIIFAIQFIIIIERIFSIIIYICFHN